MKLILGLGNTGLSFATFLQQQAVDFKIADSRDTPPKLGDFLALETDVSPTLGAWQETLLDGVDEVLISPGIAQSESIVVWARERNIAVVSDIELFARYAQAPVVGITGSNGKSTVTQLLGEMLENCGKRVAVGGNLGEPALNLLSDEVEYYVLEISSYQLDYTNKLNLESGAVLNITPDHLDRYQSFEHYVDSKLSFYKHCQHMVINLDEPLVPAKADAKHFGIDMPKNDNDFGTVTCHGSCYLLKGDDVLMGVDEMQLIGEHNVANMLAGLALGDQLGLEMSKMIEVIRNFRGLHHRLEWVRNREGVHYYNDSKATNALSTITALKALIKTHENIVLIAGGQAKNEDYGALFKLIDHDVAAVILIGQSVDEFEQGITQAQTIRADSMREAVTLASEMLNDGVVLLSPACASFDMYRNFEHRGDEFKHCVATL